MQYEVLPLSSVILKHLQVQTLKMIDVGKGSCALKHVDMLAMLGLEYICCVCIIYCL